MNTKTALRKFWNNINNCSIFFCENFEFIISSADVIFRKPEPAIFELAIAKSGLRPDEIWFCGDDSIWDIESSYQVGMTPVWFRGALDYEQPIPTVDHIVVENYKELMDVLKHLKA